MPPLVRLVLAVAGFAALAASLLVQKKAGWLALAGALVLFGLAVADRDPVLALGGAAVCLARFVTAASREAGSRSRGAGRSPSPPAVDSGQDP